MKNMILRTLYHLHELRKNQWLEQKELEKIREKKLRATIKFAYEEVPFYHKKLDAAGIKPYNIKTMEDLTKIPLTTKSEIHNTPISEVVANNANINNCIKYTTSGSTGIPLTVIFDRNSESFDAALWIRAYLENGYKLRYKMAIIADPHSSPPKDYWYQLFGLMRKKHISIYEDLERQISAVEQYKPEIIQSYPSSLNLLAHAIRSKGIMSIQPKLVFSEAEVLDKVTKRLVNSVFEAELFDFYATRELGLMAWECSAHIGFHINIDTMVTEFVKNGQTVSAEENGEIVCTSLVNRAMPLIRYKIEDTGIPTDENCPCGRKLPLMKALEGRVDDFLVTTDGRIVSSLILFPYPFEGVSGIKQFKVIQEKRDKILIQLVTGDDFPRDTAKVWEASTEAIRKVFGENMQVDFQIVEKIARDPSGKIRKVISRIKGGKRSLWGESNNGKAFRS